jgi:hypothetical protein
MQDSSGLVLSMAGTRQSSQAREELRAVDHLRSSWVSVSKHTSGAGTKDVAAVVARVAGGGRAALAGDVVENALNFRARGRRSGFEIPVSYM